MAKPKINSYKAIDGSVVLSLDPDLAKDLYEILSYATLDTMSESWVNRSRILVAIRDALEQKAVPDERG